MRAHDIIIKPVLTEKSYKGIANKVYTFKVAKNANKVEIRKAIEEIFGVPGVGALYINSITSLDYNFFMLLSAFYTFIGLAANILVDISYGFIDPRIRVGER